MVRDRDRDRDRIRATGAERVFNSRDVLIDLPIASLFHISTVHLF